MKFFGIAPFIAVSLLVSPGSVLCAATVPELKETATLSDCILYAQENNPALRAASQRWQAAIHQVPQAKGWPDPRINYGYFVESVETRVGPQEQRIGVLQPFPWFGKLKAAGDVASANAAAILAELTAAQLQITREIKEVWYELAWFEEARRITDENTELVKQLEGVSQARFKAGGTLGAVTKAQVELSKLQDRSVSLGAMRSPLQARLNSLLNRPADALIPSPKLPVIGNVSLPSDATLFTWQMEANPILETLARRIEQQEHAARLARKSGMPEFGLGFDYIVTGPARVAGMPDSGQDAAIAMFSISIPLWRGKYRAAVDEAEARRDAAEFMRENQINQLEANLKMALYLFRDAERKIDLYGSTLLTQARSAFSVAQQNYESGSSDFLNLIDAQRALLEIELEYQRALANRQKALAEIEMLVGRDVTPVAQTPANN
jgi:cobalt-zinc-cadmium efflux system outer membrane protein